MMVGYAFKQDMLEINENTIPYLTSVKFCIVRTIRKCKHLMKHGYNYNLAPPNILIIQWIIGSVGDWLILWGNELLSE